MAKPIKDINLLYFLPGALRATKEGSYPYIGLLKQGLINLGVSFPSNNAISSLTTALIDQEVFLDGYTWQVGSDVNVGILFNTPNGISSLGDTNSVGNQTIFAVDDSNKKITFTAINGVILPKMTKANRNLIPSPTSGTIVYQTDNTPGLRTYNGTNWIRYTETID